MSGILPTPTDNLLSQLEQAIQVQLRKEQAQQYEPRLIKVEPQEPAFDVEPTELTEAEESNAYPWIMDIRIQQVIMAAVEAVGDDPTFALHALADCPLCPRHAFSEFVRHYGLTESIELVNRIKEALEDAAVAEMVRADESEAQVKACAAAITQRAVAKRNIADARATLALFKAQFEATAGASERTIAKAKAGIIIPAERARYNEDRLVKASERLTDAETAVYAAEKQYFDIVVPPAPPKFVPAQYAAAASFMDSCSCIPSTVRPGVPEDVWLVSTDKLRSIIEKAPLVPTTLTTGQRNFIAAAFAEMNNRVGVMDADTTDSDKARDIKWLILVSQTYYPDLIATLRQNLLIINSRLAAIQSQKFDNDVARIMAN